jgi:hypothetical protein
MLKNLTLVIVAILPLVLFQPSLRSWVDSFAVVLGSQDRDSVARRAHLSEESWRESVQRRYEWLNKSANTVRAL